mgnify:FL=1
MISELIVTLLVFRHFVFLLINHTDTITTTLSALFQTVKTSSVADNAVSWTTAAIVATIAAVAMYVLHTLQRVVYNVNAPEYSPLSVEI